MTKDRLLGVLLCGHGSRDADTCLEFERFVKTIRQKLTNLSGRVLVEGAYLEFRRPTIEESFQKLVQANVERIVAQPLMLFAARHATRDIPDQIKRLGTLHPAIAVSCSQELPFDESLLAVALDRIKSVVGYVSSEEWRKTLLLVVGRGSSDAAANQTLGNVAQELHRHLGIGRSKWAFAGIAPPSIKDGLIQAVDEGFQRIVVFPYFLFDGLLVKRTQHLTAEVAIKYPSVDFSVAPHLADHPTLVNSVANRILSILPLQP